MSLTKQKSLASALILLSGLLVSTFFTNTLTQANDTTAQILRRGVLKVGLEAGYIPFEMKDKKGQLIGFDPELAALMAREMGVKLELVNTEWDGIIPSLLTGKFDLVIGGMTLTQQRNLKINFSDPYIEVGQSIIIRPALAGKIKSFKDLNRPEFKVASKLGTSGEEAAKKFIPRATYRAYQTEQEAVMEVVSGRIDAFVYDLPYNVIFANGKGKGKVHLLGETFTYEPIAVGMQKNDPDMLNWVNNFLRQIRKDGRYQKLYDSWFKNTDWLSRIQN